MADGAVGDSDGRPGNSLQSRPFCRHGSLWARPAAGHGTAAAAASGGHGPDVFPAAGIGRRQPPCGSFGGATVSLVDAAALFGVEILLYHALFWIRRPRGNFSPHAGFRGDRRRALFCSRRDVSLSVPGIRGEFYRLWHGRLFRGGGAFAGDGQHSRHGDDGILSAPLGADLRVFGRLSDSGFLERAAGVRRSSLAFSAPGAADRSAPFPAPGGGGVCCRCGKRRGRRAGARNYVAEG